MRAICIWVKPRENEAAILAKIDMLNADCVCEVVLANAILNVFLVMHQNTVL